jgi:hypothetical protein
VLGDIRPKPKLKLFSSSYLIESKRLNLLAHQSPYLALDAFAAATTRGEPYGLSGRRGRPLRTALQRAYTTASTARRLQGHAAPLSRWFWFRYGQDSSATTLE